MSELKFRAATPADHAELVKLAKTTEYTRDFSNKLMFSSDDAYAKGWIRVATIEGDIVGFTCVRHKSRKPFLETMLYFVVVDPAHRSQGIGELLLEDAMFHGPHTMMRLNVMKKNARAVSFYKRLGFRIAGVSLEGHAYSMEREYYVDKS